ncbi:T-complex protein 1 subunit theta [Enteropsectra breve]|nr:T-complex protein 1 subunit theta [Enteropsectra breve]
MDLRRTQLTGLLNNVTHEKTKFIGLIQKLRTLLALDKDHKLINTKHNTIIYTENLNEILSHINYKHPIVKILLEYLNRLGTFDSSSRYFSRVCSNILDELVYLMDNGVNHKRISNELYEMALLLGTLNVSVKSNSDEKVGNSSKNMLLCEDIKKFIKSEIKDDTVADILIRAVEKTKSFDVEKIRITKIPTGGLEDSYMLDGFVLNRQAEGKVKSLVDTSVALYNAPLDINRTELKGTILLEKSEDLMNYSAKEVSQIKAVVDSLNTNILVVCGNINEMFMEYADKRNIMVLRVFSKFDLKRVCDSVGGAIYNRIAPVKNSGRILSVRAFEDSSYKFTSIVGRGEICTLVIKNSVVPLLEYYERKITGILEYLSRTVEVKQAFYSEEKPCAGETNKKEIIYSDIDENNGGKSHSGLLSGEDFSETICGAVGSSSAIRKAVSKAIKKIPEFTLVYSDKVRAMRYVLEFLAGVLEVDDYLVSKRDVLDIKPPQHDGHWDEDH